ncbi:hypothetical protein S40288_10721 [Stachybotrys chartarum IBT 40288]|nr:hypothetical protein S40288_10721 [Stachybotrys chartarum IBT 40288]
MLAVGASRNVQRYRRLDGVVLGRSIDSDGIAGLAEAALPSVRSRSCQTSSLPPTPPEGPGGRLVVYIPSAACLEQVGWQTDPQCGWRIRCWFCSAEVTGRIVRRGLDGPLTSPQHVGKDPEAVGHMESSQQQAHGSRPKCMIDQGSTYRHSLPWEPAFRIPHSAQAVMVEPSFYQRRCATPTEADRSTIMGFTAPERLSYAIGQVPSTPVKLLRPIHISAFFTIFLLLQPRFSTDPTANGTAPGPFS